MRRPRFSLCGLFLVTTLVATACYLAVGAQRAHPSKLFDDIVSGQWLSQPHHYLEGAPMPSTDGGADQDDWVVQLRTTIVSSHYSPSRASMQTHYVFDVPVELGLDVMMTRMESSMCGLLRKHGVKPTIGPFRAANPHVDAKQILRSELRYELGSRAGTVQVTACRIDASSIYVTINNWED